MIHIDPYDLRRPPEHILGPKGARLTRMFEMIRQKNLTIALAAHSARPREITPQFAEDFLRAAHLSLRPS